MDLYKIIMTVIAVSSIGFNVYQFLSKQPKFKFRMSYGLEPNEDGVGSFLCARLFVSNTGGETAIYNGLEGTDGEGSVFYPSCSIEIGSKVEPNSSVVGYITNGHLLAYGTSSLFVIDGVFKKHKVPSKVLNRLLSELQEEKERLENLGYTVHPPSLFERHNKSNKRDAASGAPS
ncbi:peptidase T [Enterovibrio norvegicus]|uniref:peptidase T n=1 Tax=Enterovibrio norvegicus TaxID=188144 RepID=UPI003D0E8ADE